MSEAAGSSVTPLVALADRLRPLLPTAVSVREHVRRVVLVMSSSRGGSSIFAEMLRQRRDLLHFRAEVNPWLALSGLTWGAPGLPDSDALGAEVLDGPEGALRTAALDAWLSAECGQPSREIPEDRLPTWIDALTVRLGLQWPDEHIGRDEVDAETRATLRELRSLGWAEGAFPDAHAFFARFLGRIHANHPRVHPAWYDLDRGAIQAALPGLGPPTAPPGRWFVEEPPFVLVHPWEPATAASLAARPLVIKTPSNAYRLPLLRRFFGAARVDVLHLTRNAAASINGLYDGWRFDGFYAHHVGEPLRMPGYTDVRPQDAGWWKFDLAPGWRAWRERPLEEVCGFQWRSAHEAVLAGLEDRSIRRFTLAFEDVLAGRLEEADAWLGPDRTPRPQELPPVMATAPPRQRRWFARAGLLAPVLRDPATVALMARLGYPADSEHWL